MLSYHETSFHNNREKESAYRRVVEKNKSPTSSLDLLEEDEKVNNGQLCNNTLLYS